MKIYSYLNSKKKAVVGDVVKEIGLTQPTISYHLKEMKKIGLLNSKKVGRSVYYSINKKCPQSGERCILCLMSKQ